MKYNLRFGQSYPFMTEINSILVHERYACVNKHAL